MRIAALLDDPRAYRTLRLALTIPSSRPLRARPRASFHACASWEELMGRARRELVEVAVVDPLFGTTPRAQPGAVFRELERLGRVLGGERIVLFVRGGEEAPILLRDLARAGFPFRLRVETDGDPAALLRVLARVGVHLWIGEWRVRLGEWLGEEAVELLLRIASVWPPPATVHGLARRLHRSPATLRRHLKEAGLPPPACLLAWLHLLEAVRLRDLGVEGRTALAELLGYEEPASLSRLARRVVGMPLREILADGRGEERVVEGLLGMISA